MIDGVAGETEGARSNKLCQGSDKKLNSRNGQLEVKETSGVREVSAGNTL